MKLVKSTLEKRVELLDLLNNPTLVVEVGVYLGHFAKQLADNSVCHLDLVDPWCSPNCDGQMVGDETHHEQVLERFKDDANVKLVRKYSQEAVMDYADESIDMVYLDADHSYNAVCGDIDLWYSKVKPGGIFAGHDMFSPEHIGVTQAVLDTILNDMVFVIPEELCPFTNLTVNPSWYIVK